MYVCGTTFLMSAFYSRTFMQILFITFIHSYLLGTLGVT